MLTMAVCDDNVQFARILVEKIRKLCATIIPEKIICNVITAFTAADDVIRYLEHNTIDLLFLDIEMPNRSGFSLAEELNRLYPDMIIIFVSSFDSLVYKSFAYSPFNFLRKSCLEKELPQTFSRAIDKYIYSKDTLGFSTTDGNIVLRIKDIIYIESQKNYFNIYCRNAVYKCRGTLSQVEKSVDRFEFYRIHAAYLVNLYHVDRLNTDNTLLLSDGTVLSVGQKRYTEFKSTYSKFIRRNFSQ